MKGNLLTFSLLSAKPDYLSGGSAWIEHIPFAFLAVEGLFLLRIVGVDDDDTLMTLLDDVESTLTRLTGRSPPQSPTSLADDRVELV